MGDLREKLGSPFARKWGALIGFATVLLFRPIRSAVGGAAGKLIGVDVFILLVGMQLRQNWSVISMFIIAPCWVRIKKLFKA